MRKERLEKENLENIGRKIFAAGALREAEIDKIAAREDLFAGVLARVKSAPAPAPRESFSFPRFVRRHELGIGGAMAAVLCIGVFGLYLQQKSPVSVSQVAPLPVKQPEQQQGTRSVIAPQVSADEFAAERAQDSQDSKVTRDEIVEPDATAPATERAVYRQSRPPASSRPQTAAAKVGDESNGPEFYPVTYTGDNGESARGGRVIRVDVSRATLFAMGINVPLENESPTVKADLLVGPDGSTRAIRLVE